MGGEFDAKAYTRELEKNWSAAARPFSRVSARLFGPATRAFFPFAGLRRGQSVLDAACGPGTSSRLAARAVSPGGAVLGVDLSAPMLRLARKTTGPGARFRVMDAEALELSDGSFDAVICHLGLMLFARPKVALSEMARVLRPGGRLACLVLGAPERMVFTSALTRILPRWTGTRRVAGAPELSGFAEPARLEAALRGAGLRGVSSRRLRGVFRVGSKEAYWRIVLTSFGRLGPLIRGLPAPARKGVKAELFELLSAYERKGALDLPYEFVMARGVKPAR